MAKKKIHHSLSIQIALSRVHEDRPQKYTVLDAVREFVSVKLFDSFTSHDISKWILSRHPELASKVKANAIGNSLKRLLIEQKVVAIQAPARGRFGVYMKNSGKNYGNDFGGGSEIDD